MTEPALVSLAAPLRECVVPSGRFMMPEQIAAACEGDDDLLKALVGELLPAIRLEVTFYLRRRARLNARDADQDVDDFVQDVMVHLLSGGGRKLRAWDPARGRSLRSFTRLLTRHRLSRVLEGFRGNPWEGGAADEPDLIEQQVDPRVETFDRLLSRQQLEQVMHALRARFNERSLMLFEMMYVEQRPVPEICESMGMTRAAVDQWNVRLRKLARTLAETLDRTPAEAGSQLRPARGE